jgi:hypothetical protein
MVQHFNYSFFLSCSKNTTNKSQINIPESFAFQIKVNLEATNAYSNL